MTNNLPSDNHERTTSRHLSAPGRMGTIEL